MDGACRKDSQAAAKLLPTLLNHEVVSECVLAFVSVGFAIPFRCNNTDCIIRLKSMSIFDLGCVSVVGVYFSCDVLVCSGKCA